MNAADGIIRPELLALLPRDKCDIERAEAAIAAGYPEIKSLLPALIEWMQDANWPVARVLAPFLASIGEHIVDHVRQVLTTSDDVWKYWVLQCIVGESEQLRQALYSELVRIANSPTEGEASEELHILARELLDGMA